MKKSEVQIDRQAEAAGDNGPSEPLVSLDPSTISAEQLGELKERAGKADEHWERLLRMAADFENFKKRTTREKQDAIKFANETLVQKLIPVLDNFDNALSATQTAEAPSAQSLQAGVSMILQQLRQVLIEAGLEEVDATGKQFDPNLHEAVAQKETAEVPEGHVVQQLRKGYKLRERLLRPASVVVAKPPAA
jgi:molecular chaperone GrpE